MGQSLMNQYAERTEREYKEFDLEPTFFSQFAGAEFVAKNYNITRQDMDRFSSQSHARAVVAQNFKFEFLNFFKNQIYMTGTMTAHN